MLRLSLFTAVVALAITLAATQTQIVKNCRASVPAYNCGDKCMAFFVGCFHSKGQNQVLQQSTMKNFRSTINWQQWAQAGNAGDLIKKCAKLAVQKNVQYFGIEFYGECYFGNTLKPTRTKVTNVDGCEKHCGYDVGGPDAMVLYEVVTPPAQ
ncbi:hypothetical protein ElyMa_001748500 [Elysia marginata]|uniref:WSC domain-containing protein n=1 Tax=Elysia marginata TaxID=1093978 RepID=A0AAV4E9B9_9GAST|nr:hypothetical protein ElyMa_001748500 [Elysia marginata]